MARVMRVHEGRREGLVLEAFVVFVVVLLGLGVLGGWGRGGGVLAAGGDVIAA